MNEKRGCAILGRILLCAYWKARLKRNIVYSLKMGLAEIIIYLRRSSSSSVILWLISSRQKEHRFWMMSDTLWRRVSSCNVDTNPYFMLSIVSFYKNCLDRANRLRAYFSSRHEKTVSKNWSEIRSIF